jgi:DNA helicase-4
MWLYRRHQENERKKLFTFYKSKIESIKSASNQFAEYLDTNTGYFSNYQFSIWKSQQTILFNEIKGKPFESIHLSAEEVRFAKEFNHYFSNGEQLRNEFNKRFIEDELQKYSHFFDHVEGRKLDRQQRTAVVTDEDNNIVIAGAGSGKTTTIVGKVNYVIDRYKVHPDEILLISFTNKSASTLAERIDIEGVEAKTFHKFGKDIIAECEGRQPSIFDESQFRPLLTKYFTELLKNESYLKKVTDYFTDFLKPVQSQFEFDNQGDYIQYLKDKNFQTYKMVEVPTRGRTTYRMEVVKSIEECKIANFLLFNGVDYEYEYPYEFDTATETFRQYKPDFTLLQHGQKIYLEHFAVAKNGNVPPFFAKEGETQETAKKRYWEKINWARKLHEDNNTVLIETYSYEMNEGVLFDHLKKHLTEAGIMLRPKSPEEIWKIINDAAKDEVDNFITLFSTFITLMKSNNYSMIEVINKNKQTSDAFFRARNTLFIDIIKPIYDRYEQYLSERGEIDFSDMINKASKLIELGKYNRKFSYVIIDEFQDISIGRYQLIKAIKTSNPSCRLFCVGDDWQSIYRFSGSDIALFKEFEKYFGSTVKSKIETTYRFFNPLINLSSGFILKNPNQTGKELKGASNSRQTNYKIQYSISENQDDTSAVQKIFNHLLTTDRNIHKKEIYILGRYNFDIDRLKNENSIFRIDRENEIISYSVKMDDGEIRSLKAQFMSVHKSKGLEADIIIILNCNSGKFGFPSEMSDDQVLNLLLSEADQFENGEERRLFYVAMTRAKEQVYFVADSSYQSKFISELEAESGQSPNKKCPNCKTADVVLRKTGTAKNGNPYQFYGCTNYLYGCGYTTMEWINNT